MTRSGRCNIFRSGPLLPINLTCPKIRNLLICSRHLGWGTTWDGLLPIPSSKISCQNIMGSSSHTSAYGQDFARIAEWLKNVPDQAEQLLFPNTRCTSCHKPFSDKRCSICKIPYCSLRCQYNDWRTHRFTCVGFRPKFLRRTLPPPPFRADPGEV